MSLREVDVMSITLSYKSSQSEKKSESSKLLLPKIALSVPFIDIVLSTIFIPFSAVLILFPGQKCKNSVPLTGKVFIALGYSLLYFMQFGFFSSLLNALLQKNADRLTTWIRMKLTVLGIYSITCITLLYLMHSWCTTAHTVATVVYAVYSIFSLIVVKLHKEKLGSFVSRCNNSESSLMPIMNSMNSIAS